MDPHPIKHPAVLLARIRDDIEPLLTEIGFRFDCRNKPLCPSSLWIDYRRNEEIVSLRWDREPARLTAERLDKQGNVDVIAEVVVSGPRSYDAMMARVAEFVERFRAALFRPSARPRPPIGK